MATPLQEHIMKTGAGVSSHIVNANCLNCLYRVFFVFVLGLVENFLEVIYYCLETSILCIMLEGERGKGSLSYLLGAH